jgi:hypothetical protein
MFEMMGETPSHLTAHIHSRQIEAAVNPLLAIMFLEMFAIYQDAVCENPFHRN